MGSSSLFEYLFAAFAFILGASIGSFLNVCIYRLPLGMSVNEPKRSFCPSCHYTIPLSHNIPLLTWLILRGRCANCGAKISFRYFGVELLTGLFFLGIWLKVWVWGRPGWPEQAWALALPYWIMASLFIVATFIDFEHFIIPDEITLGGAAAGVLLSFAIPTLPRSGIASFWRALVALRRRGWDMPRSGSWCSSESSRLGKSGASSRRLPPSPGSAVAEEADFTIGEEKLPWSDIFYRDSDQVLMKCGWLEIDGERFENTAIRMELDWLHLEKRKWELVKVDELRGEASDITLPREAMGLGDVKFIACIGAFLGWKGVAFTIMGASTFGAVVGVATILAGRREWSAKIPFGPYLALAALVWLFRGPELAQWYWSVTLPPAP